MGHTTRSGSRSSNARASCSRPRARSTAIRSSIRSPEERTVLEPAELVQQLVGTSSEIVLEARPVDDPQVRQPDITKARQVRGWEPEIGIEEGLLRLLADQQPETNRPTAPPPSPG